MTLKLLDLYNTAASQEWAMYDNDAEIQDEMESSLIIDINKALTEVLYSFPFSFRERNHIIMTIRGQKMYDLPSGLILKDENDNYRVCLNGQNLKMIKILPIVEKLGIPTSFKIRGDKIILSPTPNEKSIITIDYLTLSVGENTNGEEIYALKDKDDIVNVPACLEELLQNAVITRAMLNSIASEKDENYSAYKKQSETAYRLLVKYSKGASLNKQVLL